MTTLARVGSAGVAAPGRFAMLGHGSFFVAFCMTLIAASIGAVLHFGAGVAPLEAGLVALAFLFALMLLNVAAARRRDRADFADRVEGLSRASSEIARELGELRHQVAVLQAAPRPPDPRPMIEPLARELGDLASVVEDLAKSVAVHEALFAARAESGPAEGKISEPAHDNVAGVSAVSPPSVSSPSVSGPFSPDEDAGAQVRAAIEGNRIELYLQPIVTLPQRKVRYYEALSRLRLSEDARADAAHFLPVAQRAGLLPKIDEKLVASCVQVVRRLAAKNQDIGLFLNIARETLSDRAVFSEILGVLDANRALAPSLVLEMPQAAFRALTPAELNGLGQLAERGFRFSLDRIEDFRIDARGLADRGIRFVKVRADLMLRHEPEGGAQIHPADLADLLGRYGIDLVADHIETENVVVDLLDYDVPYGQGFLFAPPRPVRADILRDDNDPASAVLSGRNAPSPASPSGGSGIGELIRAARRA